MLGISLIVLLGVLLVALSHAQGEESVEMSHFDESLPPVPTGNIFELHPIDPVLLRNRRRRLRASEMTPLFPGYGTHYVYAYVGTPPQRQSLIVDTGSHFTAFPCTGCKQCGEHTDPYWDPKKSSTSSILKCPNFKDGKCQVTQSYTEGSSWHGYKVQDKLWIGGEKPHLLPKGPDYAVNFTFACQTDETGLFRTQLADGIMGMSAAPDTLPNVLAEAKVTDSKVFALCYRNGGGIFTLGGVNQQIHAKRTVNYAQLNVKQGWYGVTLVNIRFIDPKTGTVTELPASTKPLFKYETDHAANNDNKANNGHRVLFDGDLDMRRRILKQSDSKDSSHNSNINAVDAKGKSGSSNNKDNSKDNSADVGVNVGRGVIVDSGTTDTYLPAALADGFKTAFKTAAKGIVYNTGNFPLTAAQMATLPDIAFDLLPLGGGSTNENDLITIRMPVSSYLDSVGEGKYTFRIYLTEKNGGVLGANFMNDLNVIFDVEKNRIGFVKSTCNFEEFNVPVTNTPTLSPSKPPSSAGKDKDNTGDTSTSGGCGVSHPLTYTPYTQCSARCTNAESPAYTASGTQDFIASCTPTSNNFDQIISKPCSENCTRLVPVRGDPKCPDTPWTECSHACITTRKVVPLTEPLMRKVVARGNVNYVCNYQTQTSACYTAQCPRQDGDFLLYVDLHLRMDASRWSYVYAESFFLAFTSLFHLPSPHNVELLNHYNSDSSLVLDNNNNNNNNLKQSLRLHFQVRLKRRDYKTEALLHDTAEQMITKFRSVDFPRLLIETLDEIAQVQDRQLQRRFGWLYPQDITVLSAVALPIGDSRNKYDTPDKNGRTHNAGLNTGNDDDMTSLGWFDVSAKTLQYLMVGGVLAVVLVLGVVVYLHVKLREEYALLSKDKSSLARSGQALRKLWNNFADMAAARKNGSGYVSTGSNVVVDISGSSSGAKGGAGSGSSVFEQEKAFELELSRRGLMMTEDEDDELEGTDYHN